MSSREIANISGKNHKDVMRAIRTMEPAWESVTGRKFALSEFKDASGRKLPMYELTKRECLYVATKFNDEARAKLILRWEYLETNNVNHIDQLTTAIIALTETVTAISNSLNERITRLENQTAPEPATLTINRPAVTGVYLDARNQEYDFVKINHNSVRRIIIDEVVYYSINDFCHATGSYTNAGQIARKLNRQRPIALKIWLFGNTHPAWFTTKNGLKLMVSGSRNLKNDNSIKLELRRVM
jgi:phage regulator Rha-like protein